MSKYRVLVIGLDGATWNFIKPWAESGDLPTFRKLMENGCYGILKSTIPPVTVPAWPAFFTGKNPGKFGVFGFTKVSPEGYAKMTSIKDIKARKLWEYLSLAGTKIIIMNMPLAYPPEEVNGVLISGFPVPDGVKYTYPESLQKEIENMGYKIDLTPKEVGTLGEKALADANIELTRKHKEVFMEILNKYGWDFAFLLLRAPDTVQHRMYQLENEIKRVYREIDTAIRDVVHSAGRTITILMSDHGFTEMRKMFYVNSWLNQVGMLEFKPIENSVSNKMDKPLLKNMLLSLGLTRERILGMAEKTGLSKYLSRIRKIVPRSLQQALPETNLEIDWSKTKAYFTMPGGRAIRINLKGREPEGIVDPKDYEEIREEIAQKLKELRDPETGEQVVEQVYKKEEVYSGPYLKNAPDIIFLTKEGYETSEARLETGNYIGKWTGWAGTHHIDGIFLACGPGIKKGYEIKEAHIYDLLPTILHIFGLPIPNDLDGRVLMEIFEEDSEFAKRKPRYVDPSYYDRKEDEKERLKGKIRELKLKGKI